MSSLAALKQSRRQLRNRLNRLAQQDRPDLAVCGGLCREIESLDKEIEHLRAAVTVGVYRKHQSGWTSPCQLADPCEVCRAHQAGKKRNTLCPKARPHEPAFRVPVKTAITLVTDGLAEFVNRGKLIWCVLESPSCPMSATEMRFTTKGRRRHNGQIIRGMRSASAGNAGTPRSL